MRKTKAAGLALPLSCIAGGKEQEELSVESPDKNTYIQVDSDAGEWENPNDRKGPRLNSAASAVDAADGEGYGGVLTYEWHSKMYLGAAHGVSGILFVLMQGGEVGKHHVLSHASSQTWNTQRAEPVTQYMSYIFRVGRAGGRRTLLGRSSTPDMLNLLLDFFW